MGGAVLSFGLSFTYGVLTTVGTFNPAARSRPRDQRIFAASLWFESTHRRARS